MMNRGNMGKEVSTASKSKGVKKMMMGGMAAAMGKMGGRRGLGGMNKRDLGGAMGGAPTQSGMMGGAMVKPPLPAMGMKKGGKVAKKAAGGAVKGYAKGGMASRGDGSCMKGKTKGTMR